MAEVSQIESRDSEYKGINLHPYFSWHFTDRYDATSNPTGYWSNAPFNEYGQKLSDGWCHFELDNRAGTSVVRSDFSVRNLGNTKDGSLYTVMIEFKNVDINKDGQSFYTVQSTAQVWGNIGSNGQEPTETYGGFGFTNAQLRQLSNGQGVFYRNVLTNIRNKGVTTDVPWFMCLTWNIEKGQKVSADIRISVYEGANYRGPYVPFDPNTSVNPNFLKSIRTLNSDKVPNLLNDGTFGTAFGTYWLNTGLTASISNNSLIIDGSSVPSGDHRIYQPHGFVHEIGKMYTLSCDMVATQNCQISFGRKFRTSTDEIIDDYGVTFDVTTTEQHLSGSYIASKSAYHTFQISEVSNSATVTIKNLRLEVTENPNLLGDTINPNFTGGNTVMPYPQYWFGSGGNGICTIENIIDSPVSTHSKSFRIMNNSSGNRDFQIRMHRFIIPEQKYVFTAYARAINTTSVTGLVRFYSDVANFQWTGSIGKEWTKIHIIMTTGSWNGINDASVMFGLTGAGSIEYIAPTLTRLEPTDQRVRRNLLPLSQLQTYYAGTLSSTVTEYAINENNIVATNQASNSHLPGWKVYVNSTKTYIISGKIISAETSEPVKAYTRAFDIHGTQLYSQLNIADDVSSTTGSSFSFILPSTHIPANTAYIHIGIGLLNGVNYTMQVKMEEGNQATVWSPAPEDCDEAVAGYEESNPNLYAIKRAHDGYIDYATGYIDPMDNVNAEETSDFIPVTAGEHIYFQAWSRVNDATNHWIGYGLYDSNKQFISRSAKYDGIKDVNGFIYNYFDITIPSGTAYIRCSYRRNREGYAKVERGNLPTNWTPALEDISINSCPRNLLPQSHMMKSFDCNQTEYTSYKTPQLTANADGWIHVSYDNSANTSNQDLYWMPPILNEIAPGRPYTILIEIKNFTSTKPYTGGTFSYLQQDTGKQFWGGEGYYGHGVGASSNNVNTYIARVDVETTGAFTQRIIKKAEDDPSRMTNPQKYLFRWRNYIRPQSVTSFDVRFSIYEGFYWGTYKPCLEYHNYDLRDDYSTWDGRNWALNTKKLDQTMAKTNRCMSWYGGSSTVVENYKNGFSASQVGNVNWCGLGVHLAQMDLKVGELYTASAYTDVTTSATTGLVWYLMCFNSSGTRVYPANTTTSGTPIGGGTKSTGTYYCTVTNTWTQECQDLIDAGGTISFTFQTSSNTTSGNQVYWYKPKFEKGTKATDWSPAPEDLMCYIGDETIELYSE